MTAGPTAVRRRPKVGDHYHVYIGHVDAYRGVRMFSTTRRYRYESRAAAHKGAARATSDPRMRMVIRCDFDPTGCPSKEPIDISERRADR